MLSARPSAVLSQHQARRAPQHATRQDRPNGFRLAARSVSEQVADPVALVLDRADQLVALHAQSTAGEVVSLFPEAREVREPVVRHGEHGRTGIRHRDMPEATTSPTACVGPSAETRPRRRGIRDRVNE